MNYLEEVIAGVKVDDPKGNLAFLKVEEEDNSGDEASPAPEGEGTPVPEGEAEPTPEPVG